MKLFKSTNEPLNVEDLAKLSPERIRIAKVFKKHIDATVAELGAIYMVDFARKLCVYTFAYCR